jgi:hypothetical protein
MQHTVITLAIIIASLGLTFAQQTLVYTKYATPDCSGEPVDNQSVYTAQLNYVCKPLDTHSINVSRN